MPEKHHVNGHWRKNKDGTRTWVKPFNRKNPERKTEGVTRSIIEIERVVDVSHDLTNELKQELTNIDNKISDLEYEAKHTSDHNRANRLYNRVYKLEQKKEELKALGISTKRRTALKKELHKFKSIKLDKSLGSTDFVKVGKSNQLGYVKVSGTRWSGFMSNVKGAKSLANTTDINHFELISKNEYDNYIAGKKTMTTSFMGATETKEI